MRRKSVERFDEEGVMALKGVEGAVSRRATKSIERFDEEGLMKWSATKGKAANWSSKGKKAAGGASGKGKKMARESKGRKAAGSSKSKNAAAEVEGESDTGGQVGRLTRLPQEEVDYILALKPETIRDPDEYHDRLTNDPDQFFSQEYIERGTEILRTIAELKELCSESFDEFQAWVRQEFEEKGCVEVDEEYMAGRAAIRQAVTQEQWDASLARFNKLALELELEE